jgi:hypothetical protein
MMAATQSGAHSRQQSNTDLFATVMNAMASLRVDPANRKQVALLEEAVANMWNSPKGANPSVKEVWKSLDKALGLMAEGIWTEPLQSKLMAVQETANMLERLYNQQQDGDVVVNFNIADKAVGDVAGIAKQIRRELRRKPQPVEEPETGVVVWIDPKTSGRPNKQRAEVLAALHGMLTVRFLGDIDHHIEMMPVKGVVGVELMPHYTLGIGSGTKHVNSSHL